MRARSAIALLGLALGLLAAVLAAGCGAKYQLPTEHVQDKVVTGNGSYTLQQIFDNMVDVQDVLLTPRGAGSDLFVCFQHYGGTDPTLGNGAVLRYKLTEGKPIGPAVQGGIHNPGALAFGSGSGGDRLFVLDQGDTLNSKTLFFHPGPCDTCPPGIPTRWITDLSRYWRVREYPTRSGDIVGALDTVSSFTDTTLAWVNGIAADDAGNVFVSGLADVSAPTNQPGIFTRVFVWKVYKYARGPRYPGNVPGDPTMPGAAWHRDTTYFHTEGTGIGYVRDPRGMWWWNNPVPALYIADFGNNSGEMVSDVDTTGYRRFELDGDGLPLIGPLDIATDASGYVYICDTGNRRALRFSPLGAFVQPIADPVAPLLRPVAIAADDSIVYIGDRGRNQVLRFQRQK